MCGTGAQTLRSRVLAHAGAHGSAAAHAGGERVSWRGDRPLCAIGMCLCDADACLRRTRHDVPTSAHVRPLLLTVRAPQEVPAELPEPVVGINFARDGMLREDWLTLVAVHSDVWLLSVAFYWGSKVSARALLRRAAGR